MLSEVWEEGRLFLLLKSPSPVNCFFPLNSPWQKKKEKKRKAIKARHDDTKSHVEEKTSNTRRLCSIRIMETGTKGIRQASSSVDT